MFYTGFRISDLEINKLAKLIDFIDISSFIEDGYLYVPYKNIHEVEAKRVLTMLSKHVDIKDEKVFGNTAVEQGRKELLDYLNSNKLNLEVTREEFLLNDLYNDTNRETNNKNIMATKRIEFIENLEKKSYFQSEAKLLAHHKFLDIKRPIIARFRIIQSLNKNEEEIFLEINNLLSEESGFQKFEKMIDIKKSWYLKH